MEADEDGLDQRFTKRDLRDVEKPFSYRAASVPSSQTISADQPRFASQRSQQQVYPPMNPLLGPQVPSTAPPIPQQYQRQASAPTASFSGPQGLSSAPPPSSQQSQSQHPSPFNLPAPRIKPNSLPLYSQQANIIPLQTRQQYSTPSFPTQDTVAPSLPGQSFQAISTPQQQVTPQNQTALSSDLAQGYGSYQLLESSFNKESSQQYPSYQQANQYVTTSSTLGQGPSLDQPVAQYTFAPPDQAEDYLQYESQETLQDSDLTSKPSQSAFSGDSLARVLAQDGEEPQSFTSARALIKYLKLVPEAENDQGCRIFKYGPRCPAELLMPLFEHFDFSRFSMFPYGLNKDFSVNDDPWGAGSCKCERCKEGRLCGEYVLHKNFRFYFFENFSASSSTTPKITSSRSAMVIQAGERQANFVKADWNLQVFRSRSRRLQASIFANDALIYQNYNGHVRLRSSPIDYVLSQLEIILTNWESLLNASSQFLDTFRIEVLEERLESDRSIIRNLLLAAQHWEEFRRVLQTQLKHLEFLENIANDSQWTTGIDDFIGISASSSGFLQRFRAIDYRITVELIQETDSLIQRITNLITIDEGYRSRDQNESIKRLTWITFIFLPLIFTAGIFGTNVDLFKSDPSWTYYLYTSLVLTFIVFSVYAFLRSRRRISRFAVSISHKFLSHLARTAAIFASESKRTKVRDLEQQSTSPGDPSTVLKWAASSGRTDIVQSLLDTMAKKRKLNTGEMGHVLLITIQNGHKEAAILLIENNEGILYEDDRGATMLHWAAKTGQASVVQKLIEKGVNKDAKDQDGNTPLDLALTSNDELTINLLLKGGKTFTKQETADLQSLHFSARTGDLEMIKEFHKKGSSLEARDAKGQTVLFHAVRGKQYSILTWLLDEKRANINAVDRQGLTALHLAASMCDVKSAEILIDHEADVHALSSKKMTPLLCIPDSEGVRVLLLLLEKGADINAVDKYGSGLAHFASRKGDTASLLFKIARDRGAKFTAPGNQGNTPAHYASESGSVPILDLTGLKGSELDQARNSAGYTPLFMAARAGKINTLQYLLKKECNYNEVDSDGRSLIELTIEWGNSEVMSTLQDFGANYSEVSTAGMDAHPIWNAAFEGKDASVAKILDGGFSIEYQHRGLRLLQRAIEARSAEIVRGLLDRGAAVDIPDMYGWTALHSAAFSGNIDIFLPVFSKAKSRGAKDHRGWTPLDLAAFYKYDDIKRWLDPKGEVTYFAWMRENFQKSINATEFSTPEVVDSVISGVVEI